MLKGIESTSAEVAILVLLKYGESHHIKYAVWQWILQPFYVFGTLIFYFIDFQVGEITRQEILHIICERAFHHIELQSIVFELDIYG